MAFDLDDEELEATRRLNGVAKEEIDKAILRDAKKNLLDKNDTESAKIIVEKCLLGNWVIVGGRINYIKLALRTLLAEREADKKRIEKLKEKLLDMIEGTKTIKKETPEYIKNNYVPKQKVIEEIDNLLNSLRKGDISRISYWNGLIQLKENLLEDK